MDVTYGDGSYTEGQKHFKGKIILAEHKLYLRGPEGDLASTFIPLEKIEIIKKKSNGLIFFVRPNLYTSFEALISGGKKNLDELCHEVVNRRGLKKKFLKNEWIEIKK